MNKYQAFCQGLIEGTVPFKDKFYVLNVLDKTDNTKNGNNIKMISPTQSSVDKAKSEIEEQNDINMNDINVLNQSGGSSSKAKRKSKAKKPIKKGSKSTSKAKRKKTSKKTTTKKSSKKLKRPIWM